MTQHDEFDELVKEVFGAPAPSIPSPAPLPEGCLPFWRFRPKAVWSNEEAEHVASCRKCQGKLATQWEAKGAGLTNLRRYAASESTFPYSHAMRRYLEGAGKHDGAAVVLTLLRAGSEIAETHLRVAKLFEKADLVFGRADAPEVSGTAPPPSLMVLPPGPGVPVEVAIWETKGEIHIHGSAEDDSVAGKDLLVEIWDDFESYRFRAPFEQTDEGLAASFRGPIELGLSEALRAGVAAVAWIEDREE